MNTFDNIRHDISDASFSVNTAIELLSGMEQDDPEKNEALHDLIAKLIRVMHDLEDLSEDVSSVEHQQPA